MGHIVGLKFVAQVGLRALMPYIYSHIILLSIYVIGGRIENFFFFSFFFFFALLGFEFVVLANHNKK